MTTKIAFVSCAYATYRPEQPAWQRILDRASDLDLLLLLGDTAYMNWDGGEWDFEALNACYEAQFGIAAFRELIAKVPTLAIWDDHDCGINNVRGAEVPELVRRSRELFDRWMGFAVNAGRPEMYGVYDKLTDVRILMLDGRSERTLPTADNATMLGKRQEAWLWEQLDPLRTPQAPITIVASGVGISSGSASDVVAAYPEFWERLRRELAFRPGGPGDVGRRSLFLAGDIHRNEFRSHEPGRIHEAMSSGVACFVPKTYTPDQFTAERHTDNWGLIRIDADKVTIAFHGKTDPPGTKRPNNFERTIRRSDWSAIA